jgi:hypothetical protein
MRELGRVFIAQARGIPRNGVLCDILSIRAAVTPTNIVFVVPREFRVGRLVEATGRSPRAAPLCDPDRGLAGNRHVYIACVNERSARLSPRSTLAVLCRASPTSGPGTTTARQYSQEGPRELPRERGRQYTVTEGLDARDGVKKVF